MFRYSTNTVYTVFLLLIFIIQILTNNKLQYT